MAEPATRLSVEAYLDLEASSADKHELLNGVIYAMAGGSPTHNLICANVLYALTDALRVGPCRVLGSDQRVRLGMSENYVYPDVSVVCERPDFADDNPRSLLNPKVVVEVASPSTGSRDRGSKLLGYRRTESIQEVVIVSTDEPLAEVFRREEGRWVVVDIEHGAVVFESLDVEIPLDAFYAKVEGLEPESGNQPLS